MSGDAIVDLSTEYIPATAYFYSSVLHLRGGYPQTQPLEDESIVFSYNGEEFGGFNVNPDQSDTLIIFSHLKQALEQGGDQLYPFFQVLSSIRGPWSFALCDVKQQPFIFLLFLLLPFVVYITFFKKKTT